MPRQAKLDVPGTLHHVILRGIEKRRIVDGDKDRQNFVKRLGDLAFSLYICKPRPRVKTRGFLRGGVKEIRFPEACLSYLTDCAPAFAT